MRKIGAEVAAGAAIFFAFVLFVFGFLFLKNTSLKAGRYHVQVRFDDVSGLEKSDPVSVSGLRVGKVVSFKLDGLTVIVDAELEPEIKLPSDSRAQLKSLGMVGEKFIDIVPGASPSFLNDGDIINGYTSGDLEALTGSAEGLMRHAEELIIKLKAAFDNVFDPLAQENLKETMQHVRNLSVALDRNSDHLEKLLANSDELSQNMNDILTSRKAKIEESIDNLHGTTGEIGDLTAKIDSSLTTVRSLLAKIENQEGSVGKVLGSDELYNNVRDLTVELDTLLLDLQKRPQKYINLDFIRVF